MNRYKILNTAAYTAAVAAAAGVANYARAWIESLHVSGILTLLLSILVLALCFSFFNALAPHAITAWRPLRRFILGRQYVEGNWIDNVRFADGGEMFGVLRIDSDGLSLRYGGTNYDRTGSHVGSFSSKSIDIDFPVLTFKYRTDPAMTRPSGEGLVILTFEERDGGSPSRFTAACVDYDGTEAKSIEGWKISNIQAEALGDPIRRHETVRSLIEDYFPQRQTTAEDRSHAQVPPHS